MKLLAWIPLILCGACFSPSVPVNSDGGSDAGPGSTGTSGASGSEETNMTAATGPDGSGNEAPVDEPPTVTLTLDGDADPNAITEHGTHTLAADAADDGEIISVEFWRGDTLLDSLDAPPFEVDVVFSSVDTGFQEYRALATDDAGQSVEDDLDLSVNIAGGNVEDIEYELFEGASRPVSLNSLVTGAITKIDGRLYLSATRSDGSGILVATLPELEVQWQRDFDGPLWARSSELGSDQLAVAASDLGNWVAYILDRSDGTADFSWVLGPDPGASGAVGPHIIQTPAGLLATTTPTNVGLFDLGGNDLDGGFSIENGVVTELSAASDGGLAYVGFGDALNNIPGECSTNSEFCLPAIAPGGGVAWVTGLSEQLSGIHRAAPTGDGGAFVATKLVASVGEPAVEILRVTSQGVVSDAALFGETGFDNSGDRVTGLASDNKGGVVACGGDGVLVHESSSPSPFVAAFDSDLNLIWELRDFIEATDGGYALACAATDDAVYVYGLRDMVVGFVDEEPWLVGSAWLARVSL